MCLHGADPVAGALHRGGYNLTMLAVTLLTCTRNGADMIRDALAAAMEQRGVEAASYEILVVDNGSTDGTPEIAAELLGRGTVPWRCLSETREGKLNAFLRGVREARGEAIAIVDDDNIVAPDFVARVTEFFARCPTVGMIGSANTLDGVPEPDWFGPIRDRFACGTPAPIGSEVEEVSEVRVVTSFAVPPGAGSCFRRTPLVEALDGGFFFMNDTFRGAKMAVTGEDTELCFLFQRLGWRFGIDRGLHVRHRIRPDRLTWPYALRLCRSTGAGGAAIDLFIAQNDRRLGTMRASWWWLAARRCRRLLGLAPRAMAAQVSGRRHDPVWFAVHTEFGALRRLTGERGRLVAAARRRADLPWAEKSNAYI